MVALNLHCPKYRGAMTERVCPNNLMMGSMQRLMQDEG